MSKLKQRKDATKKWKIQSKKFTTYWKVKVNFFPTIIECDETYNVIISCG